MFKKVSACSGSGKERYVPRPTAQDQYSCSVDVAMGRRGFSLQQVAWRIQWVSGVVELPEEYSMDSQCKPRAGTDPRCVVL